MSNDGVSEFIHGFSLVLRDILAFQCRLSYFLIAQEDPIFGGGRLFVPGCGSACSISSYQAFTFRNSRCAILASILRILDAVSVIALTRGLAKNSRVVIRDGV